MPHDSEIVQINAMLRSNILDWPGVPVAVQLRVARFIIQDRARQRDRIMIELGHDPAPPEGCLFDSMEPS